MDYELLSMAVMSSFGQTINVAFVALSHIACIQEMCSINCKTNTGWDNNRDIETEWETREKIRVTDMNGKRVVWWDSEWKTKDIDSTNQRKNAESETYENKEIIIINRWPGKERDIVYICLDSENMGCKWRSKIGGLRENGQIWGERSEWDSKNSNNNT